MWQGKQPGGGCCCSATMRRRIWITTGLQRRAPVVDKPEHARGSVGPNSRLRLLPPRLRPFPSARGTHYARNFAAIFAAVSLRLPLQEAFGDPRPQAFFFLGPASSAGGRDAALVAPALLGLFGFGRDDSALRRCEDPARLRGGRSRPRLWLLVFSIG